MTREAATVGSRAQPSSARLWFGVLGGPVAWAAHTSIAPAIAGLLCPDGATLQAVAASGTVRWVVGALSLVFIAVTVAALATAWRTWRRADDIRAWRHSGGRTRVAFMAIAGIMAGSLSLVGLVYGVMPVFLSSACVSTP